MLDQYQADKLTTLTARRDAILEELSSDDQFMDPAAVSYGSHDPFDVPVANCDRCGSSAESKIVKSGDKKSKWIVGCKNCDNHTLHPQKDCWTASLVWNNSNLESQSYTTMSVFELAHLAPAAAKEQISKIRRNLILRLNLCSVDRSIAEINASHSRPGRLYQLKLEAYLKWAMLAHRLVKNAKSKASRAE